MDIGFTRVGGVMANNSGVSSGFDDNVSYRGDIKSGIQGASDRDLESDVDADNITARVKKAKNVNQALNVMANYHSGIAEGKVDRKKEFLNNHGGWESVKNKIDSWTPEDFQLSHAASKVGASKADVEAAKKAFKDYLNNKNTGFEALFNNEHNQN